jgi:uncharacterized membrane protein
MNLKDINPEHTRAPVPSPQARLLAAARERKRGRLTQPDPLSPEDTQDPAEDNPALSDVIDRNIRTLVRLRLNAARDRNVPDHIADAITAFSGRILFVFVHVAWFGSWILLNTGWFGGRPFDPFPYGLLTLVVALEAIFLLSFVLIGQNRLRKEAEHRADLQLHLGLLTEHELIRVLQRLDAIQDRLGVENDAQSDLAEREMETRPDDMLVEIARLQQRTPGIKKAARAARQQGE